MSYVLTFLTAQRCHAGCSVIGRRDELSGVLPADRGAESRRSASSARGIARGLRQSAVLAPDALLFVSPLLFDAA